MSIKQIYIIIGSILVIAVVAVAYFSNSTPTPDGPAAGLPPGHPDVSQMEKGAADPTGAPSASNVRKDFIHEMEMMQKHADENPNDTTDLLKLGQMLYFSHKIKEAVPYYERYLKAAPKNTDVMFDLALAYYDLQKTDKALEITQRILRLEPKNSKAMYNLGAIYATQGNKAEAKKTWQKLLDTAPDSEDAGRAKESMKQL
ncbi:MAG: tetratricopeptide repeat protein [Ignavibacteria bacterium]|nr:tetratricopeptide repeat protein [Ignavibacteria bacterium]